MRLTSKLQAQHIANAFQRKWLVKRERKIADTGASEFLKSKGFVVEDALEVVKEKKPFIILDIVETIPKPPALDSSHPDWHERPCHFFNEKVTLVEGLDHAKVLTKTVEIQEGLPKKITNLISKVSVSNQDLLAKRCYLHARVFDAVQKKIPRIWDETFIKLYNPYRVPKDRMNLQMLKNILQVCSNIGAATFPDSTQKSWVRKGKLTTFLEKDENLLAFDVHPELLIFAKKPLQPCVEEQSIAETEKIALPDIYPITSTLNLAQENIYKMEHNFSFSKSCPNPHVHLAVFLQNDPTCKWTDSQFAGQTLAKIFGVALAQARQRFGETSELPEPITVQSIHSDGQLFQFSVFQLNSANLSGVEGKKNILWITPKIPAFDYCDYRRGKPTLEGYNPAVFQTILAMYINGTV